MLMDACLSTVVKKQSHRRLVSSFHSNEQRASGLGIGTISLEKSKQSECHKAESVQCAREMVAHNDGVEVDSRVLQQQLDDIQPLMPTCLRQSSAKRSVHKVHIQVRSSEKPVDCWQVGLFARPVQEDRSVHLGE